MAMMEAAASGRNDGASEPAACHYLMLGAMNKSSVRIGTFLVRVSRPQVSSYSYRRRSGQGLVTQHKYSCLLLGAPEETGASGTSCYCMGVYKGTEKQVKEMAVKYQEGVALKLSKVTFDGSISAQYMHTPHQVAVDMGKTTIHIVPPAELLMSALKLGSHLVPPRTVAETVSYTHLRAHET